jgi:hypothetical protein
MMKAVEELGAVFQSSVDFYSIVVTTFTTCCTNVVCLMFYVPHAVPIPALNSIKWLGFIIVTVSALYEEWTSLLYVVYMQGNIQNVKPDEC